MNVVKTFHTGYRVPYSTDGLVHDFYGEDAEELIYTAAESIGLSRELVAKHFLTTSIRK